MGKLVINSYEEFEEFVGRELGTSDYHKITQEQINKFADATLDYQWIHVDEERAKKEGPFGATIAHGYLSVSLLAYLWYQVIEVNNVAMLVNYGIESMRFGQAVVVNSEVRIVTKLKAITNLRGIAKTEVEVVLEIKGSKKNALKGVIVFLYQFK
jgi:acyl dehydratase